MQFTVETLVKIVILIIIIVLVAMAVTFTGRAAGNQVGSTTSNVSAAGFSSQEIQFCELNCPSPKSTCNLVPCEHIGDGVCKTAADSTRKCSAHYAALSKAPPASAGGGGSSDYATFTGVFLPKSVVTITLPASLQALYDPADAVKYWTLRIIGSDGSVYGTSTNAAEEATFPASDKISCTPWPTKAEISTKPISCTLPSGRTANNIETKIKEKVSYTAKLYYTDKTPTGKPADGKDILKLGSGDLSYLALGTTKVVGMYPFSWICPLPSITNNSLYESGKDVEFTFSSYPWVDVAKYDDAATKIEVGMRTVSLIKPCYDGAWVSTCSISSQKPDGSHKNNWFTMPPVKSGQPVAISYPVYAQGITIGAGDPMCRSGKEGFVFICPASACVLDTGKYYILSTFNPSGTYTTANPSCSYDVKSAACPAGCTVSADGKSAACSLPKPDISNVFMMIDGTPKAQLEFDKNTGAYKSVKDFVITQANHPGGRKWAIIVVKNNALPATMGADPVIEAKDISFSAWLDSNVRTVSSLPVRRWYKVGSVWTEDLAISPTTKLEPGQYFEYEVDLVENSWSETFGAHSGSVLETVAVTTAPSKLGDTYSYVVYFNYCATCTASNAFDCGLCASRCAWESVSGFSATCVKKV